MKKELKAWLAGMGILAAALAVIAGGLWAWKEWSPGKQVYTFQEIREEIDLNRLQETAELLLSNEEVLRAIEAEWQDPNFDSHNVNWLKESWLQKLGQTGHELLKSYFNQKGALRLAWDIGSQAKCICFVFRGGEAPGELRNLCLYYIVGEETKLVKFYESLAYAGELQPIAPHWYEEMRKAY